jgi:hypothetical protein
MAARAEHAARRGHIEVDTIAGLQITDRHETIESRLYAPHAIAGIA